MKKTNKRTVAFRRKREGKTNYKKRLNLLKSKTTRLVVRKSLTNVYVQFIDYNPEGDKVIVGVSSKELEKYGWKHIKNNIPTAYLTGLLAGKKSQKKNISKAILDLGFNKSIKGSKIYATVKGVIDAGIEMNVSDEMFPSEDRLQGKHIEALKDIVDKDKDKFKNQLNKSDVSNLSQMFEDAKNKIMKV